MLKWFEICLTDFSFLQNFLTMILHLLLLSNPDNDHLWITTTCLQQPPFWSPNFSFFYKIKLPLSNDQLSTKATTLRSQGWSVVPRFDCISYFFLHLGVGTKLLRQICKIFATLGLKILRLFRLIVLFEVDIINGWC